MKANELMLGDYVTFRECQQDAIPTIVKIWQINGDNEAFVSIDGSDGLDEISIDDEIVGIPLTEDILEKNGFQYFHRDYASLSYDDKFRLLMVKWPDENGFGGLWTLCDIIEIEFVHELQRALRVCKIDKNIVL